jgi:F5/8 type C domain
MTKQYLSRRAVRGSLVALATMRLFSSAPAFVAAGALAWGCTVYDSGLVPSNSELTGTGTESNAGGHSGASIGGNTASSAGKSTTAGTFSTQAGDAATGGSGVLPEGGVGGEGGEASTGKAGSVSGGGKAGSGGAASGGKGGAGGASAGNGGSGGSVAVVACADHPVPLKTTWTATASSFSVGDGTEADGLYNPPAHMLDGSYTERWSSGKAQSGDEWIQIDFGVMVTITDLTLNPGNDAGDFPGSYAVRISNKALDFAAAVKASGTGMTGSTFVHFAAPITGRYLTVRQTGLTGPWWTVAELLVGCTDS